jgi:hypothetical protein
MSQFPAVDTEDREQLCRYLEAMMDLLQIESSHGLLNTWLYGAVLGSDVNAQSKRISQAVQRTKD